MTLNCYANSEQSKYASLPKECFLANWQESAYEEYASGPDTPWSCPGAGLQLLKELYLFIWSWSLTWSMVEDLFANLASSR